MEKVDVSICSYKKPESLLYTLLSLKKICGNLIDTVYIQDDCSSDGTIEFYKDEKFLQIIAPIKIEVRENSKRIGWYVTVQTPESQAVAANNNLRVLNGAKVVYSEYEDDIRYQWGINSTNKKYLFIIT